MQIKDIAFQIVEMEKVPIYFNNTKTFSSVTYLQQNSDQQRGFYLPDFESLGSYEYCQSSR